MADRDGVLLLEVVEEGALVVDLEVEDAVLVGQHEGDGEGGRVAGGGLGLEAQAVEGGQHAELELELVVGGDGEGRPLVPGVLGDGDGVGLPLVSILSCNLSHSSVVNLPPRS